MRRALPVLALLLLGVAAAAGAWLWRGLALFRDTPFGGPEEKVVVVPRGASPRTAVHALMRILDRGEKYVRDEAAWALGRIGPEAHSAVPTLIQAPKGFEPCS